jgi:hypothetical protein
MGIESETSLANMALSKIGAARITDIDSDTSVQAIQCQLHFDQTRDALLRSFEWNFAIAQAPLSEDSSTPTFHYDHQFLLPDDFIRVTKNYDGGDHWEIQGQLLLTDEDSVDLEYVAQITDTTTFDPLFIEVLVLRLALKMLHPLAGTNAPNLKQGLMMELREAVARAKCVDNNETNTSGGYRWSSYWD